METINYNGMELKEFISAEPKIFNPPARMVVWDGEYNIVEEDVYVYDPRRKDSYHVITATASWLHCALLPDPSKSCRATNRELAKWLAQGNGEVCYKAMDVYHVHTYSEDDENADVMYAKVRKWSDTKWHEPTVDYMGIDDKDYDF